MSVNVEMDILKVLKIFVHSVTQLNASLARIRLTIV